MVARPDGRFLITKRVVTKAWAPGWWEVSGGAVQAGEAAEDAVIREVKEETGLDVTRQKAAICFLIRGKIRVTVILRNIKEFRSIESFVLVSKFLG